MEEEGKEIYTGEIEGRKVELFRDESAKIKVMTTRGKTEAFPGFSDGNSHLMPFITCEGDPLEILGENPDDLEMNLQNGGNFTPNGAREISNLAR